MALAAWLDAQIGGLTGLIVALASAAGLYLGVIAFVDRRLGLGLSQSLLTVFPGLRRWT